MTDEPEIEVEAEDEGEFKALLPTLRMSVLSQVASILLHALIVVPIWIPGLIRSDSSDLDVEWLTEFEDLEGLGMSSGRWADVKVTPDKAELDEKPGVDQEPPPEEESTEPEEPPEKPEKTNEKPEKKPEPTRPEDALAIDRDAPVKDLEPAETPAEPDNPYARGDELAGIDRSGPSGLPDLEAYGPGNVVYSALVRLDRIRGTGFEEPTRRILENVPDYRIALQNTGIDPVTDIDSLFMASARPRYIQHTFVAVRHSMEPDDLKGRLERRFVDNAPWFDYKGYTSRALVPDSSDYRDPRQIVLARPGLAVIARPEWLPEITGEVADDDPLANGLELEDGEKRPTMLDGLAQIERALGADDTLIAVSGRGVRLMLPGLGGVRFEAAKLVVADASAPKLTIDMTFDSPATAKKFSAGCPRMKEEIMAQVPWGGRGMVQGLLDPLECRQKEQFVTVRGSYRASQIERVMNFAVIFIPRPPVLTKLPVSPPPPRPAAAPDAGTQAPDADAGTSADASAAPPEGAPSGEEADSGAPEDGKEPELAPTAQ